MPDRKLYFVTGKGGVGKSTVVAALAVREQKRGRRVLVATSEPNERLSLLLGGPPFLSRLRQDGERLWTVNVDPPESIQEYGAMTLGSKRASAAIFGRAPVRSFLAAVPGLYPWAVLGKVIHHAGEVDSTGTARFDVVVFDAPATGHAVEMLRVPRVIMDVAPAGILRRDATRGWQKLTDPARTAVVLVSLPEPTPVDETLELDRRLREIGVASSWLVVNQVVPALFQPADARALAVSPRSSDGSAAAAVVDLAAERARRELLQEEALDRLRRQMPIPTTVLPCVPGSVDAAALQSLVAALGSAP